MLGNVEESQKWGVLEEIFPKIQNTSTYDMYVCIQHVCDRTLICTKLNTGKIQDENRRRDGGVADHIIIYSPFPPILQLGAGGCDSSRGGQGGVGGGGIVWRPTVGRHALVTPTDGGDGDLAASLSFHQTNTFPF